jgi:hypothetical protein
MIDSDTDDDFDGLIVDTFVGGHMEENEYSISECSMHVHGENGSCAPKPTIDKIRKFLVSLGKYSDQQVSRLTDNEIIKIAKSEVGVDKESQLYTDRRVQEFLGGSKEARKTLEDYFKAEGPANSTALLDNFNIDETIAKWAKHSESLFGKKFYHVPFQMIDFAQRGTELAHLNIRKLMSDGYKCFGVVLNTDVSSGRGKHWFAIYGDLDHKGTDKDPIVLEYFNSSGNPPMREVANWLEAAKQDLLKNYSIEADSVVSANRRLQNSMTECGVWSLMYILSRLKGHEPNWYYKTRANDADMIELRSFLFRDAVSDKK